MATGLTQVWSEREGDIPGTAQNEGDWEACVATAYSMGLLYGGVQMASPYTQYQRELLEYYGAAADLSQDLAKTDAKSLQVYGVKLRGATPGLTAAQALGRPGIGMCLTTNNSPGGYGTGFTHEVFWVAVSENAGLLYDPLAPMGSQPQSRTVAYMLPWLKGLGDNDLREVKQWEFGPPPATGVKMAIRPVREDFNTKTGSTDGKFYLDGPGVGSPKYFITSERVTSVGETTDGLWRVLFYVGNPAYGGEYLWMARANLVPVPGTRQPPTGYATELSSGGGEDLSDELAAAEAEAAKQAGRVSSLKTLAAAHVATQTAPERDYGAAVDKV